MGMEFKYYLSSFKYKNDKYKQYAKTLYGKDGFCIIKSFLNTDDISYLLDTYVKNYDYQEQIKERSRSLESISDGGYHSMTTKYFFKNRKTDNDERVNKIIKNVFNERNKIILQEESDKFALEYCIRNKLDINDIDLISDSQLNHTNTRLTWYRDSEGMGSHIDSPGEIQAILFLTKQGKDYEGGGLSIHYSNTNIMDADHLFNPGDLVLFNAYSNFHSAKAIKVNKNQVGRIQLLSHMHPDWLWGPRSVFKENKYKLYFSHNYPKSIKFLYYIQHYIRLLVGKVTFTDNQIYKK